MQLGRGISAMARRRDYQGPMCFVRRASYNRLPPQLGKQRAFAACLSGEKGDERPYRMAPIPHAAKSTVQSKNLL